MALEKQRYMFTVGDLRRALAVFPDDRELTFGPADNHLTFYRTKARSEDMVNVEFNELYTVTERFEDLENADDSRQSLELSVKDRLILRNQFKLLAKTDPEEAEFHNRAVEILESGYTFEYYSLAEWFLDPMSNDSCREVREILEMYRSIDAAMANAPDESATVPEKKLKFPGFDGNDETKQYAYARFLLHTLDRWKESKSEDLNTHRPMLPTYREMLARWRDSASCYELSRTDVQRILGE